MRGRPNRVIEELLEEMESDEDEYDGKYEDEEDEEEGEHEVASSDFIDKIESNVLDIMR